MQTKLNSILLRLALTLLLATSFALSEAASHQSRDLSFADRVAYQRAIEDVYWRHRIWPRSDPKPSLDAVMSQAQLEQKVIEYLRNSQKLEDCQGPMTADQLQAEMDRMAEHTKQPGMLRELFAALSNDPFVIAECLARPVLAEHLATSLSADDQDDLDLRSSREAQDHMSKLTVVTATSYRLPTISDQLSECYDNWTDTSTTGAPLGRQFLTAVWTGSEMIVWGGYWYTDYFNTGGRYNPSTDSWTATSTVNAPTGREWHTAVWTGSEMIVWGGTDDHDHDSGDLNTGGRYNPDANTWTATSMINAPTARARQVAVWTGSEMIVWGGTGYLNTGGRYNPNADSWTATSTTNAPSGRESHTAVWSGSEMIVWGGLDGAGFPDTGGKYNPGTDTWTATGTIDAPTGREGHTAVWSGSEMIVWGGYDSNFGPSNTGGRYDPSTDGWTATTITNAPTGRYLHTAVWTGDEMIVWGGVDDSFAGVATGGRYNPSTDSWTATTKTNAPYIRYSGAAIWTNTEMIIWGGYAAGYYPNEGGRYCAQTTITLEAQVHRQGGNRVVLLTWSPADDSSIIVWRNGNVIGVTDDDGSARDKLGTQTGTFIYQVCEANSGNCSNEARIRAGAAD